MGLANELSCEAGSFSCCCLSPTGVFSQWFEALFLHAGALGLHDLFCSHFVPPGLCARKCGTARSASYHLTGPTSCTLLASCSPAHPTPQSATSLGPPAATLPRILSAQLPVSAPPIGLDECFLFNSLVVRLPYSLIFCQFWLFFVFKLLSFFWLCEEA